MSIEDIVNELKTMNFQVKEDVIETLKDNNQIELAKVYDVYWNGKPLLSFFDTWEILRGFGTPNVANYGGMYISGGAAIIWINGYGIIIDPPAYTCDYLRANGLSQHWYIYSGSFKTYGQC